MIYTTLLIMAFGGPRPGGFIVHIHYHYAIRPQETLLMVALKGPYDLNIHYHFMHSGPKRASL